MAAQIWPFRPRSELIESLGWLTDVFQAKAGEQRSALRIAPRRSFNLEHVMTDIEYSAARAMIRASQADEGFLLPDWAQSTPVGAISTGSNIVLSVDLSHVQIGDTAILWESSTLFETVAITIDSSGVTLDAVANDYTRAALMPLLPARAPQGLSDGRGAAQINQCSIEFLVFQDTDIGFSDFGQYLGHDVLPSCPVIGGADFAESIAWGVSQADNGTGIPRFLRARSYPDLIFQMRWHYFTRAENFALRQWLYSRRGKQKAFWLSSRGHDLQSAADVSGIVLTVFSLPGISGMGRTAEFDIDVTTHAGISHYRRITAIAIGTPIDNRDTLDLTIDSSLTVAMAEIKRISFLRCARLNTDRIELNHAAAAGTSVHVPCIEIPAP